MLPSHLDGGWRKKTGCHRAANDNLYLAGLFGDRGRASDTTLTRGSAGGVMPKLSPKPKHKYLRVGRITQFQFGLSFPNVWPAPGLQVDFCELVSNQSAVMYPAPEHSLWPCWRYARLGPHKSVGLTGQAISEIRFPGHRSTVRPSRSFRSQI